MALPRVIAFASFVASTLLLSGCASGDDIPLTPSPAPSSSCYVAGSCPQSGSGTSHSGFTNNTGWEPTGKACCDICAAPGTHKVNCFDKATCGNKTGDNDWDFVILDQIWLPQFCSALEQGHDPTLTHMPGSKCDRDAHRSSNLSIHGLWPNYINGYPQCCKHMAMPQDLPPAMLATAQQEWVDPTLSDDAGKCGWCSMWAHETMKHGTCFATDMAGYFGTALGLLERLESQTKLANGLLQQAGEDGIRASDLAQVFAPFTVQLLCDGRDAKSTANAGVFLELRTCWSRTGDFSPSHPEAAHLEQINCPGKAVGTTCPSVIVAARNTKGHKEHAVEELV